MRATTVTTTLLKASVLAALAAAFVTGLAGCGTRGNLELPPEEKAANATATAESGQGKAEGTALKPHKPFVLDGFIL